MSNFESNAVCLTSSYDSHVGSLCGELAGGWHRGHDLGVLDEQQRQLQLRGLELVIRECFDLEPYKPGRLLQLQSMRGLYSFLVLLEFLHH